MTLTSCARTVTQTEIKYILPDIPESMLEPCETIQPIAFTTNGELLMAYVSLQASYAICSSKVSSISMILKSYNSTYSVSLTEENE